MNRIPANRFVLLSEDEKLSWLQSDGVYIGKLKKDGFTSLLFQLDCYYIEVCYLSYRQDVLAISVIEDIEDVKDYITLVEIPEILLPVL